MQDFSAINGSARAVILLPVLKCLIARALPRKCTSTGRTTILRVTRCIWSVSTRKDRGSRHFFTGGFQISGSVYSDGSFLQGHFATCIGNILNGLTRTLGYVLADLILVRVGMIVKDCCKRSTLEEVEVVRGGVIRHTWDDIGPTHACRASILFSEQRGKLLPMWCTYKEQEENE